MPTDPHVFFEEMILNERLGPDDYRRLVELLWDSYSRRIFLFAAAKLQNEAFVNKAPKSVVDQQKTRKRELLEKNEKIKRQLATLAGN